MYKGDPDSEDSIIKRGQNKTVCPLSDYRESDSSNDDNNDIQNLAEGYVGQNRQISYLTTFTENPGVKKITSDPEKFSEVAELFLEIF